MNEALLESFNKVEQFHWWWAGRQELVKNLLPLKKNLKILDIGCGTGETLTFIKKIKPQSILFGVDNSSKAVAFTQKRGHQVKLSSAQKLVFKTNTFDVVLLLDVIEHIKDDSLVIKEAARVLKKDGLIIITSPGLQFIYSAHDKN